MRLEDLGPLSDLLLSRLFLKPATVQHARQHAERGVLGHMEGHAEMDMSVTENGEGGIRTPDGLKAHTGFRDRRIQPLCHLSKRMATS